MNAFETLQARGFVQQSTGAEALSEVLESGPVTLYVGYDPTADSLHVGHLIPVMAMAWLQRMGHRVLALVGGGTAMVGDPSGKTEMRQMLSQEQIRAHGRRYKDQLSGFLDLDSDRGTLVNNADWLLDLGYIDFLREVGKHFSVNRMLAAEAYKQRLQTGLSFIEFNYQLLQAYDFVELNRRHGCTLQMGGDDQWGNILAGVDLTRRMNGAQVHGCTQPLILTASGAKMGKTAKGAVWLAPERRSPFDYFQYWLNVDDRDVGRFLKLYTFLPLAEIERLTALQGAEIREAKRVLAREATTLLHGAEAAERSEAGGRAMAAGAVSDDVPTFEIDPSADRRLVALLVASGMTKSLGEGRRLIKNGGIRIGNDKVIDTDRCLEAPDLDGEGSVLRVGKKRAIRVVSVS